MEAPLLIWRSPTIDDPEPAKSKRSNAAHEWSSSMRNSVTVGMIPRAVAGAVLGLLAALAPANAQQSIEERRACAPDVMRLCREFVPNTDMINSCLAEKKAELSPACRVVMFGAEPSVATPATPAKQQAAASAREKPKVVKVKARKISRDCD
jgi:hypothetical protein